MAPPNQRTTSPALIFVGGFFAALAVAFIGLAVARGSSSVQVAQPAPTIVAAPPASPTEPPAAVPEPTLEVPVRIPAPTVAPAPLPTAAPPPSPTPTAAPLSRTADSFDVWLPAQAGSGTPAEVLADLEAAGISPVDDFEPDGPQPLLDTVTRVLAVDWQLGRTEMITWIEEQPSSPLRCTVLLGAGTNGGWGCTTASHRNRVESVFGQHVGLTFGNVQPDVTTIAITTYGDTTIGTQVIANSAFAAWDRTLGQPAAIDFLDDNDRVLHSVWFDEGGVQSDGTREGFDQLQAALPDGGVIPFPGDAPEGDIFVRIAPGRGAGTDVQVMLDLAFDDLFDEIGSNRGNTIIEGTGHHIGTVHWALGTVELILFDMLETYNDTPEISERCLFTITDPTPYNPGHFNCGNYSFVDDVIVNDVQASWSDDKVQSGIFNAQDDAAWVVVDTYEGVRIVSPIVENTGLLIWQRRHGRVEHIALLDADHQEIWFEYSR